LVVASIAAAACGGDDDSSSATTTEPAAATTAPSATTAAGTTGAPTTKPEPKDPINIGMLIDQSGPAANTQAVMLQGAELAIKLANEEGGVDGHPIELKVENDESTPAKDVAGAIKLIEEDNVKGILGPMLSGGALAVIEHMKTSGTFVPMVGTSGDPGILHGDYENREWYFNTSLDTQLFARDAVDALVSQEPVTKMGSLVTSLVSAESAAKISEERAKELGIEWTKTVPVALEQTDILAAARELKDSGADGVVIWVITSAQVLGWLRAKEQLSWDVPWAIADINMAVHYDSVPELIEGAIIGSICDPRTEGFQAVMEAYEAEHGKPMPVSDYDNFGAVFNGTRLMLDAMSRATDPTDPAAIQDALESTSGFQSTCQLPEEVTLSPDDHVVAGSYPFFRFVGGEKEYFEFESQ
jgi:branched-chain amino acid transport system substrate-binding protein